MAIMYPQNINEYLPTGSERVVYQALKDQLPDDYIVFYSISWSEIQNGKRRNSEVDFILLNPRFGYLCLEVKGGSSLRIQDQSWYLYDEEYGERRLNRSPYEQAEASMYYFKSLYADTYHTTYPGIYAAGVIFPFFSVKNHEVISNRDRECTIDAGDMGRLREKIEKMFKVWSGGTYGKRLYERKHHETIIELIKKKIALSAAAGALIQYKEKQLDVINRVQDNYIYLIKNLRQFYFRGGAGTGKTWIAMKLARKYSSNGEKTLFICVSKHLADWVSNQLKDSRVEVLSLNDCIQKHSKEEMEEKYDAILIDEAQDFTEEWAYIVKLMLRDERQSHLGVFYDDAQVFRADSFGDAFMIDIPPLLLRENIRNTFQIYKWAIDQTRLGEDVVMNPVEGPAPKREMIRDNRHLTHRLENLFQELIEKEKMKNESLAVLVDQIEQYPMFCEGRLAKWNFVEKLTGKEDEIRVQTVEGFKGLEADMVIYIHQKGTTVNENYIAYTRAKYYLYEMIC